MNIQASVDVYVINLKSRPDRRAHMVSIQNRLGLSFRFVDAVDGRDPDAEVLMGRRIGSITGRERTRADYACVTSHRLCWKMLIESGSSYGLILEDDVIVADDFANFLDSSWISPDADIIKLETTRRFVEVHNIRFESRIGRSVGVLASKHLCAAGYILSRAAAKHLWEQTLEPMDQVDHILFTPSVWKELGLKVYQVDPAPVVQTMYHPDGAAFPWGQSSLQSDRDARGYTMVIEDHRRSGRQSGLPLRKLLRSKSLIHGISLLRSRLRRGAYKRVQFG